MSGKQQKRLRKAGVSIDARRDNAYFDRIIQRSIEEFEEKNERRRKVKRVAFAVFGLALVAALIAAAVL